MFKFCRLPSGSPCLFIANKLKIYLTKNWLGFDFANLHGAIYIDLGYIAFKYKKKYDGHCIY
jgi:hypothetical protein